MTIRSHSRVPLASLLMGASLLALPGLAGAQNGPGPRLFPPGLGGSPVEAALQNSDEIGLTPEQRARLEDFQEQSTQRTASAREVIEAWRAEQGADDVDEPAAPGSGRPFRERGLFRELTPEVREAVRTLRDEARISRDELASTVTVAQMRLLQGLSGVRRPALGPNEARFRGGRFGGQRVRGRPGPGRARAFRRGPASDPRFRGGRRFGR